MKSPQAPNVHGVNEPGRRTVYSICGMCAVRCPIQVDVENGKVTWIQGNPHDKTMETSLCAKGSAGLALEYDDERPSQPLIRTGPRGGGQWRKAEWGEALDFVAGRLKEVIAETGGRGVVLFGPRWTIQRPDQGLSPGHRVAQLLRSRLYLRPERSPRRQKPLRPGPGGFVLRYQEHKTHCIVRPESVGIPSGQGSQGIHGGPGAGRQVHLRRHPGHGDRQQGHAVLADQAQHGICLEPGLHSADPGGEPLRRGIRFPLGHRSGGLESLGAGEDSGVGRDPDGGAGDGDSGHLSGKSPRTPPG